MTSGNRRLGALVSWVALLCLSSAGVAGAANAVFTVTLSAPWPVAVSVHYATADGTATAGNDYTARSGTLVIPAGATSGTISVPVQGDVVYEPNETFTVTLSSPVSATIDDGQAVGTIQNDDPLPQIVVEDCAAVEGSACTFNLTLQGTSSMPVTSGYATSPGTATVGADYSAVSGTVSFAPLTTGPQAVAVPTTEDAVAELDETFTLNLANAIGGSLPDPSGAGTIVDDDAPSLSTAEVSHGLCQLAHFGPPTAAVDLFRFAQQPRSSYEVLVDATTGDAGPLTVERLASDNSTVLGTGAPAGIAGSSGRSRSMRWYNPLPTAVSNQHIRIRTAGCAGGCAADDVYRVCAYETTQQIPRFNSSGSQVTVVIIQNPTAASVTGNAYFWSGAGALLHQQPLTLAPHATTTINTSSIPALVGRSGSVTITHDASFGALSGKAVAVEPATGYSFDSPMQARP